MTHDRIRLGVTGPALAMDPREAIGVSRELGFEGLQFDIASPGIDFIELSGSGRREFRRVLSSRQQDLIGLRVDLGARGFGPGADVDRLLRRLSLAIEAAAQLGAPLICIELGPIPHAPENIKPKPTVSPFEGGLIVLPESSASPRESAQAPLPPADPGFVAQVNAAMGELGRTCDRYSTIAAFRSELASFASLAEVIRAARCPWFGIDLDLVAHLRDSWNLDEVFSELGPLIRHVRGRDAIGGADRRTKPAVAGQGNVEWEAIIANLHSSDYRSWITVDPVDLTDRIGAASAGLKYLRSIGAGAER